MRSPRSSAADIDRALDAAHTAAPAWGKTPVAKRANLLLKIAERIEQNLEMLAVAESWDNGKPIRMTLEHYQQTKNLLISHDINPLGFF